MQFNLTLTVDLDVSCDLDVKFWADREEPEVEVGPIVTRWLDPKTSEVTTLGVFLLDWAARGVLAGYEKDWYEDLCRSLVDDCWDQLESRRGGDY